ncbi:MAG: YidH family protein [Nostocoides sp.]
MTPPEPSASAVHWSQQGEDPDYRFTLANERTFLAWIRTSLALIAGGVALKSLVPPFAIPGLRTGLSLILAGLGLVVAVSAYQHWRKYEIAMRQQRSLPPSKMMVAMGLGLALAAVIVVVEVITSWE